MYFNKTTVLFLMCMMIYNNFFAMIQVVNPDTAHFALYLAKDIGSNVINTMNKFTKLHTLVNTPDDADENYNVFKEGTYANSVEILKNCMNNTGSEAKGYVVTGRAYNYKEKNLDKEFCKKFESVNNYNPLNLKNVILFGPYTPLIEWVSFKMTGKSPTQVVGEYIFNEYISKDKDVGTYVYYAFLLSIGGTFYISFLYFVPSFIVKDLLRPLMLSFVKESGIKIEIPKQYQPLLAQGVVGFVLHKMKK